MPKLSTGELIAAIRKKAGYSQEALARVLGVSYPTVNSWERGRSKPRSGHLTAIADLAEDLGVSRGPTVLVIDDDPTSCAVVEGFILGSEHPAAVETTTDASTGLLMCGTLRPDLLLLDVLMPGLDGFEVARKLESIAGLEGTMVVLMTASTDPRIEQRATDMGHSFINKPLTQEAIDDLRVRLGEGATIDVVLYEDVVWRDGSLGCPQPGMAYTQALEDGYPGTFAHLLGRKLRLTRERPADWMGKREGLDLAPRFDEFLFRKDRRRDPIDVGNELLASRADQVLIVV